MRYPVPSILAHPDTDIIQRTHPVWQLRQLEEEGRAIFSKRQGGHREQKSEASQTNGELEWGK